jgi:hypothetical protein
VQAQAEALASTVKARLYGELDRNTLLVGAPLWEVAYYDESFVSISES